jgi:rubredoxin
MDTETNPSTPEPTSGSVPDASLSAAASSAVEPSVVEPSGLDRYECRACGYIYEPLKGDDRARVSANTDFVDLPQDWRCPVCSAPKKSFSNIGVKGSPSGFKENLGYGLGVNTMTPSQKNLLIFGGLGLAFLFFLSLYGLQ